MIVRSVAKRGFRWSLSWLLVGGTIASLVTLIAALALLGEDTDTSDGGNSYSEAELGLEPLIRREYAVLQSWAHPSNGIDTSDGVDTELEDFYSLQGHERERRYFEYLVSLIVISALEDLAGDLNFYSGRLARAYEDAFEQCAAAHEMPGSGSALASSSEEHNPGHDAPTPEWTESQLAQLRPKCAAEASEYPTLTAHERDDLTTRTLRELTLAVEEWMDSNPHLVVPLEYHPGANRPFAAEIADFCERAPDPHECAISVGKQ